MWLSDTYYSALIHKHMFNVSSTREWTMEDIVAKWNTTLHKETQFSDKLMLSHSGFLGCTSVCYPTIFHGMYPFACRWIPIT